MKRKPGRPEPITADDIPILLTGQDPNIGVILALANISIQLDYIAQLLEMKP